MSAQVDARFTDGKDDGALRTIGEVSSALGIKTHVLRYWEQQFPSLDPLKRSGRRYYRAVDIALLQTIDRLVNREGYTLKGAQQALKSARASPGQPTSAAPHVAAELAPELGDVEPAPRQGSQMRAEVPADVVARLKSIRDKLAAAIA